MELQVRIGRRIRRRREELGMTQQELAGPDLTRGFISQLEKGIVMPSLKSLELLATRLYRPVSYFLEASDAPEGDAGPTSDDEPLHRELAALEGLLFEGHFDAAGDRYDALVRAADAPEAGGDPWPGGLKARLELAGARLRKAQGQPAEGIELAHRAVARLREAGRPDLLATGLVVLGALQVDTARWEPARVALEEALQLAVRHPSVAPWDTMQARLYLGMAVLHLGQPARAVELLGQVEQAARASGWCCRPGELLVTLGRAHQQLGDAQRARGAYQRALEASRCWEDQVACAAACEGLASLALQEGETARAGSLLEEALAARRRAGGQGVAATAETFSEMARALAQRGQAREAIRVCRQVLPWLADEADRARLLLLEGQLLASLGETEAGRQQIEAAAGLAERAGLTRELAAACSELGNLLRRQGEHVLAGEYLARAVSLFAGADTNHPSGQAAGPDR